MVKYLRRPVVAVNNPRMLGRRKGIILLGQIRVYNFPLFFDIPLDVLFQVLNCRLFASND